MSEEFKPFPMVVVTQPRSWSGVQVVMIIDPDNLCDPELLFELSMIDCVEETLTEKGYKVVEWECGVLPTTLYWKAKLERVEQ